MTDSELSDSPMTEAGPAGPGRSGPTLQEIRDAAGLIASDGTLPSRNEIMRKFGVGAGKAAKIRTALEHQQAGPMDQLPVSEGTATAGGPELNGSQWTDQGLEHRTGPRDPVRSSPEHGRSGPVGAPPWEPVRTERIDPPDRSDPPDQSGPVLSESPPAVQPRGDDRSGPGGPVRGGVLPRWPLVVMAAPAFVATWSGWVGLGQMAGFGPVRLLPGIADGFLINSAITLPIGVEVYAAYALAAWLSPRPQRARTRRFARNSAAGALMLGASGQVAFHLLEVAGYQQAPWPVTIAVSCLPVAVLAMAAALRHLLAADAYTDTTQGGTPAETGPAETTPASDRPRTRP